MREIKFRVWDKETKEKYELQDFHFDGDTGKLSCVILQPMYAQSILSLDDVIIEQYTGLKDSQGKDIYEGDIIQEGCDDYLCTTVRGKVYFDIDELKYMVNELFDCREELQDFKELYECNSDIKVIGNIHEEV